MKDTVYFGGDILTMERQLYEECLWVKDGVIQMVGPKEQVLAQAGPEATQVDLQGKCLLPGFIDGHSHITSLANTLGLLKLDKVENFQQLKEAVADFAKKRQIPKGEWVIGFGYDHNHLAEKAHPTRKLLDEACPDHPVLLAHASGHMGVANSLGLAAMGLSADTPDPEGGRMGRTEDGSLTGYLEENAFIANSSKAMQPSRESLMKNIEAAQEEYLRYGITTVQDGFTKAGEWSLLTQMAQEGRLKVDVVCYADMKGNRPLMAQAKGYEDYQGHLKMGGYKIFLDGSPQGRTAWMTQPYLGGEEGYCGYPIYSDEQVEAFMEGALEDGKQILVHCNGDAAAQQMIDAYATARNKVGKKEIRPVMVHAQLTRRDQLQQMAKLHMLASFFTAHTYHWGDVHLQNFGKERAMAISAARTADKVGVPYTFHQDSPVIPPDMIETLWCAVNRISREGADMGKKERISTLEALRAITIQGAYQYFEEEEKGSLRPGKKADMVVLSANPLTTDPQNLKELEVCMTIKEGQVLYQK